MPSAAVLICGSACKRNRRWIRASAKTWASLPPLVRVKINWATTAAGVKPTFWRRRGSSDGSFCRRFHKSKRRQRASTKTWPPWAVAWSELVSLRWSLVFCLVMAGIALHHHYGDVISRPFSPENAFLFTRLRIGATQNPDATAKSNHQRGRHRLFFGDGHG